MKSAILDKKGNVVNVIKGAIENSIEIPENQRVFIGDIYKDGIFNRPKVKKSENDILVKRNILLSKSDWTQIPDSPLSAEKKAEWAEYRQALRDITNGLSDPNAVVWPDEPA